MVNKNMTLPDCFSVNDFEEKIAKKIDDKDQIEIINEAYQLENDDYILVDEIHNDSDKRKKITDIFQSLGILEPDEISQEELNKMKIQIEQQNKKIDELTLNINEYESLLKRKQAEFENYRKRTLREKEEFRHTANQKFIEELLPIVDNFEKAIDSSQNQNDISIPLDGIVLIEKQLKKFLEAQGVEVFNSVGEEFDPNLHEAIQIEESDNVYPVDTVIKEWQKGYLLGGKMIRHSKVVVAKGTHEVKGTEKIKLPASFDTKIFETDILMKIDNQDHKKLIKEVYQKKDEQYVIKNLKQNNEKHKKIIEILTSIGCTFDKVQT